MKIEVKTAFGSTFVFTGSGDKISSFANLNPPLVVPVEASAEGEQVPATLEQPERPKRKTRKHAHGG